MMTPYYEVYEQMTVEELRAAEDEFCADPENAFCCRACPIAYRRGWDDRFAVYGCSNGWCEVRGAVEDKEKYLKHRKRRVK